MGVCGRDIFRTVYSLQWTLLVHKVWKSGSPVKLIVDLAQVQVGLLHLGLTENNTLTSNSDHRVWARCNVTDPSLMCAHCTANLTVLLITAHWPNDDLSKA